MDETSLKCPLCCEESFDSLRSLKMHISDVLNKLECPICKGNFNAFENFAQHLLECEVCESENTESINDSNSDGNSKNLDENNFSGEKKMKTRMLKITVKFAMFALRKLRNIYQSIMWANK